jgi:hypothetical protein
MASFGMMGGGGGQGGDVLSQVDSYIDGNVIGMSGSRHAGSGGTTPGPTLIQTLADGVRDLLGGERARRHHRENDAIRGTTRQPASQVVPPLPDHTSGTETNPDGSLRSPSQMLLDGLMSNFGVMNQ